MKKEILQSLKKNGLKLTSIEIETAMLRTPAETLTGCRTQVQTQNMSQDVRKVKGHLLCDLTTGFKEAFVWLSGTGTLSTAVVCLVDME